MTGKIMTITYSLQRDPNYNSTVLLTSHIYKDLPLTGKTEDNVWKNVQRNWFLPYHRSLDMTSYVENILNCKVSKEQNVKLIYYVEL
jgi:hypothetical protein